MIAMAGPPQQGRFLLVAQLQYFVPQLIIVYFGRTKPKRLMFSRLGLLLRLNMITRAVSLAEMFRILPEPTGTSSKQKLKSPANY
jgi:hypothetical protein